MKNINFYELLIDDYHHANFNVNTISSFDQIFHYNEIKFFCTDRHANECLSIANYSNIDTKKIKFSIISHFKRFKFLIILMFLKQLKKCEHHVILSVDTIYFSLLLLSSILLKLNLIIYCHSLVSIFENNKLHRRILMLFISLTSIMSAVKLYKSNITVVFQKNSSTESLLFLSLERIAEFKCSIIHSIVYNIKLQSNPIHKRRFLFLGGPRKDKNFNKFTIASRECNNASLIITSRPEDFDHSNKIYYTVNPIFTEITNKDIVFLYYDFSHYKFIESATLIEAISAGAWIYTSKKFLNCTGLSEFCSEGFRLIHLDAETILVKFSNEIIAKYKAFILTETKTLI